MIPPWFQECLYWMKSVIWRHLLDPFIFSIIVLSFHGSNWSDPYVKDIVSISQHLLQPSILLQAVCSWFEWYVCLRKAIVALLFYWGVYLFHRTTCSDICLKSSVLNARKNLQPPHCLLVNVLICNFTIVIAAIP